MAKTRGLYAVLVSAVLATGCGMGGGNTGAEAAGATQQGGSGDYGATKQMVIDILHSKDGRSAMVELAKDPQFKQQMAVSETDVAKAVEKTVETNKTQSFLSQQVKDPKFAEAFAKSIQPELIQINRQLMKDPAYQKDLTVLLKSPDFTKHLEDLLQTPEFRGQIMKLMTDALQTPSFRMQFQDALKQAVADSIAQAGGKSGGQKGQQSGQGGGGSDQSGGGGSGDSGGGGGS